LNGTFEGNFRETIEFLETVGLNEEFTQDSLQTLTSLRLCAKGVYEMFLLQNESCYQIRDDKGNIVGYENEYKDAVSACIVYSVFGKHVSFEKLPQVPEIDSFVLDTFELKKIINLETF
jgi:hypothetical protein